MRSRSSPIRGLHGRVSPAQWQEICRRMRALLQAGQAERAVVGAIQAASALIAEHYPAVDGQANQDELPNRPQFLG